MCRQAVCLVSQLVAREDDGPYFINGWPTALARATGKGECRRALRSWVRRLALVNAEFDHISSSGTRLPWPCNELFSQFGSRNAMLIRLLGAFVLMASVGLVSCQAWIYAFWS